MAPLPPGIYRIIVSEGPAQGQALTRTATSSSDVTILPVNPQSDDQKWQIASASNGNVTIVHPSPLFPAPGFTYGGPPGQPQQGNRVIVQVQEFPTEWQVGIVPGSRYTLRVAGSQFGIITAPIPIYPPILQLTSQGDQFTWAFERV